MSNAFQDSQHRIKSMALIHEKLYQSKNFAEIDLGSYIKSLCDYLFRAYSVSLDKVKLYIDIKNIKIQTDDAVTCGLIINELLSNSLKYAFPQERKGEVSISITKTLFDRYLLIYKDNGIGIPDEVSFDNASTLGLKLVQLLTKQLKGAVTVDRTFGTTFNIEFKSNE